MTMLCENEVEVVISGIGGIFPKCNNIEEFKTALLKNESLLGSRWKSGQYGVPNSIGVTDRLEYCDNFNLGINSLQCPFVDPMHRLILERAVEALIDAGINPNEVMGRNIAVYTGSEIGERDGFVYENVPNGYGIIGIARNMMANRISYMLNLHGPSVAYAGSWLSGVLALQAGVEAVREGFCEAAFVGTSNLALTPKISRMYHAMGLLSPDGTTRSFDDNANGYARCDGVVVFYIQRASDARRSYATILGVDSIFDGYRDGTLLSCDKDNMTKFLKKFYSNCKIDPRDVGFVECNGNGCKVTEEIELSTIEEVFCKDRKGPLLIGSVKPNTGNAEASAIMFSIVKVLIAMETGIIPANINFKTPNRCISALRSGSIKVVSSNTEWNSQLAAVNGIGISSSYGHVLLRRNHITRNIPNIKIPLLTTLSTRTDKGIHDSLRLIKLCNTLDYEYHYLIRSAFKQTIDGHIYRGYAILNSLEHPEIGSGYHSGNKRQVWFIYSGMGSQWSKMGADLMALPLFEQEIQKCHRILEKKGLDLIKIITSEDANIFDDIINCFVGIAAIQVALTNILHAIGVTPDGMIGHSVGELGCAYADGCFTDEQVLLAAYSRGKASKEASLIRGMMAAVGMGHEEIQRRCPPTIEIACHNSSTSCTISGPADDMSIFVKELQTENIFARLVNVSNIAYHSRYIKPAAPLLLKYLREIIPESKTRSPKWVSTSIPQDISNSQLAKTSSAEYHTNNLLSPVLFEEAVGRIPNNSILIEIAPHGLLQAILRRALDVSCSNVSLTNRSAQNGLHFLMSALGRMYVAGIDLNVSPLYPVVEYPVSRGTPSLCRMIHWDHTEKQSLLKRAVLVHTEGTASKDISLNDETYMYLNGHMVEHSVIFPVTSYLILPFDIQMNNSLSNTNNIVFENLEFREAVTLLPYGSVAISITKQRGSGNFQLFWGGKFVANGNVNFGNRDDDILLPTTNVLDTCDINLAEHDVYDEFVHRGHHYTGYFKSIKSIKQTSTGLIGIIQWNNNWQILLEAMLQLYMFHNFEDSQGAGKVSSIRKIVINVPLLPRLGSEMEVIYDFVNNIIACEAINIYGITSSAYVVERAPSIIDELQFVGVSNTHFDDIELGLNMSIHIVLDKYDQDSGSRNIAITELESYGMPLETHIINAAKNFQNLKANITKIVDSKPILGFTEIPLLIVVNGKPTKYQTRLVISTNCFMLALTDETINVNFPQIIEIVQFYCKDVSYSLYRKCASKPNIVIKVDIASRTFASGETDWAMQVKSAIHNHQDSQVYLVLTALQTDDIYNFMQNIRNTVKTQNVRFMFIVDNKAPSFNSEDSFYKEVFERNLAVAVIKDGCAGMHIWIPRNLQKDTQKNSVKRIKPKTGLKLNYIGANVDYENEVKISVLDYSGLTESDEQIMGLAKLYLEQVQFIPDSILHWNVPDTWSLENAATLPYAYSYAYYALVHKGSIAPGETVLIHNACSSFGIAAIHIAHNQGCTIYATISEEPQRSLLENNFSCLKDGHIFSATNPAFEGLFLNRTSGNGANVVLNCTVGSIFAATLRCVANFGRIIELGNYNTKLDNEMGMKIFLRNVSIMHISSRELLEAPSKLKSTIHKFVRKSIEELLIKPLPHTLIKLRPGESISSKLQHSDGMQKVLLKLSETSQIYSGYNTKFDSTQTVLVYTSNISEMWINLIEWLTFRGARKFLTFTKCVPDSALNIRRLKLLERNHNISTSSICINTKEKYNIKQFVTKNFEADSIGALFICPDVPCNSDYDREFLEDIELALEIVSPNASLVNMLKGGCGMYQSRINNGFTTYNIQWSSSMQDCDFLNAMDDVLKSKSSSMIIKTNNHCLIEQESDQSFYDTVENADIPGEHDLGTETCNATIQILQNGEEHIQGEGRDPGVENVQILTLIEENYNEQGQQSPDIENVNEDMQTVEEGAEPPLGEGHDGGAEHSLLVTPVAEYDKDHGAEIESVDTAMHTEEDNDELRILVPNSKEGLKLESELMSTQLDFLKMASLCTKEMRECPPLFVIPGMLQSANVPELAQNLLYAVHTVQYDLQNTTLPELAETLALKIKRICQDGPYNIIGVSLGGILAIEIVRILEESTSNTRLFLLDGAPNTIQNVIRNIGDGKLRDAGLLCRVFNINNIDTMEALKIATSWEEKIKLALNVVNGHSQDLNTWIALLGTYSRYLNELLLYRASTEVIQGRVWLLRPKGANKYDTCGLEMSCKYHPEVVVLDSAGSAILADPIAAHTINQNAYY